MYLFFFFLETKIKTAWTFMAANKLGHNVAIFFSSFRNKMATVRYTGRQTQLEHNVSNPASH